MYAGDHIEWKSPVESRSKLLQVLALRRFEVARDDLPHGLLAVVSHGSAPCSVREVVRRLSMANCTPERFAAVACNGEPQYV